MDRYKKINGITFRVGQKSQMRMFRAADKAGDNAYIATDFTYGPKDQLTKGYASFRDWNVFLDEYYYPRYMGQWSCYELIREGRECKVHFDLDWDPAKWTDEEVLDVMSDFLNHVWETSIGESVGDVGIMSATTILKGSLHLVLFGWKVERNEQLKDWVTEMIDKHGNDMIREVIDVRIYTKNRLMRLPYSSKLGGTSGTLVPRSGCRIESLLLTALNGDEKKLFHIS